MKFYLALNKHISSDSLLRGNSRRSWEFLSVIRKLRKSLNWCFPPAYAHRHTLMLMHRHWYPLFITEGLHLRCAYESSTDLQFQGKRISTWIYLTAFSKISLVSAKYRKTITHLIFVIHGVTCYSKCISSCDYKCKCLLQGLVFLSIQH